MLKLVLMVGTLCLWSTCVQYGNSRQAERISFCDFFFKVEPALPEVPVKTETKAKVKRSKHGTSSRRFVSKQSELDWFLEC